MTKQQLEHILRAAAAITGQDRFVVIGSQAILGSHHNPPAELTVSIEADIFCMQSPQDAELIDGSIGEGSPFHRTFGYYAHGVGVDTAVLPSGWQDRLIPFESPATRGAIGLCLEPNDLAVAKLVAGREKDLDCVGMLLRFSLVSQYTLRERIEGTPLAAELRGAVLTRLSAAIRNSTAS